jgi:hypothetical protein
MANEHDMETEELRDDAEEQEEGAARPPLSLG